MKILGKYAVYVFLAVVAAGMAFPVLWMLIVSMKEAPEQHTGFRDLLMSPYSLANYGETLRSDDFGTYFANSLLVASAVTAANVLFCMLTGYAFARRRFPLKQLLFATVLGVMMIPPHVIMIPLYRLMVNFGWINSYFSLIMPWLVTPFGVFLVRQYLLGIPRDIEDAARIDGAGQWRIIFGIMMPLCRPVLTVLGIYTFLANWNSFLFPFLFTNDSSYWTLPVGLSFYIGKQSVDWGNLMAGAAVSALPIIILFIIFQKKIIQGLTAGALKE